MRRLSRRSFAALILAAVLLAGVCVFCVSYAVNAESWVVFPGNPHGYHGQDLSHGAVTDRSGEILMQMEDGRTYAETAELRRATVHLLGDRDGNIPSPAIRRYAARLIGYSPVFGLYGAEDRSAVLEYTVSGKAQVAALTALGQRSGTVFVYNYRTGEILCAVSTPTFDPDAGTPNETEGIYVNRAFGALYPPGSIFKVVTAAVLLEQDPQAEQRIWRCDGTCELSGEQVTCQSAHGDVTLSEALARSCNCAFAQISQSLDRNEMEKAVDRWGVTAPCAFDGYTAPPGRFELPEDSPCDAAWACIGQHTDLVNPCAFARFLGTIAGGGQAAEPYLVKSVGDYHGKTVQTSVTVRPETAAILQEYLANNVETVYGKEHFPDVTVCAKSGTAEVGEGQTPNANFAGFVLDERYPLAFYVTVENGGSGSTVCAPIAGAVLRACCGVLDGETGG